MSAYDPIKYSTLHGYADDIVEIVSEFGSDRNLFVGHSVSAMIGMLADLKQPGQLSAHLMIGPSPCYINDGDYVGGFTRADIESLLDTLEGNYLGWSSNMAPAIMGAPDQPELATELTNSFCHNHGAPIPSEALPSLFQPMSRSSNAGRASRSVGLGLYIVQEIARAHGGRTSVTSLPGAGTTFTTVIPQPLVR